jgi:hypothetical protein
MAERIISQDPKVVENRQIRTGNAPGADASPESESREAIDVLLAEGGESLYNYVEWLGLEKDPNLVVLSSVHHYFYDDDDFKDVKTVINLKQLNQIKNVDVLLDSIFQIIPQKSNFVGSFFENKKKNGTSGSTNVTLNGKNQNINLFENDIISKIPFLNMIYSLLDSKTNRFLTRKNVTMLLEDHGFKVMDMTELNGLTYFLAQKIRIVTE